jgi:hypothetical protein
MLALIVNPIFLSYLINAFETVCKHEIEGIEEKKS